MSSVTLKLTGGTLSRKIGLLPEEATHPCDDGYAVPPVQVDQDATHTFTGVYGPRRYKVVITNLLDPGTGNKKCDWAYDSAAGTTVVIADVDASGDPGVPTPIACHEVSFTSNAEQGPSVKGELTQTFQHLTRKIVFLPANATAPCDTRNQGSSPVVVAEYAQYEVTGLKGNTTYKVAITNLLSGSSKKCAWANPDTIVIPNSCAVLDNQDITDPWVNPQFCPTDPLESGGRCQEQEEGCAEECCSD